MFNVIYNPVQPYSKPSVDALNYAEKLWFAPQEYVLLQLVT